MKPILVLTAFLGLALAGCGTPPLSDGTYYVKSGKVGTLPDGTYKIASGAPANYDPATGKTTPVNDPTTSLWGIIAAGIGAMIAGRLVGIASAQIPFLAPVAPILTAILGGSGFRPSVVTTDATSSAATPPKV